MVCNDKEGFNFLSEMAEKDWMSLTIGLSSLEFPAEI